jgi:hypothetical protein
MVTGRRWEGSCSGSEGVVVTYLLLPSDYIVSYVLIVGEKTHSKTCNPHYHGLYRGISDPCGTCSRLAIQLHPWGRGRGWGSVRYDGK